MALPLEILPPLEVSPDLEQCMNGVLSALTSLLQVNKADQTPLCWLVSLYIGQYLDPPRANIPSLGVIQWPSENSTYLVSDPSWIDWKLILVESCIFITCKFLEAVVFWAPATSSWLFQEHLERKKRQTPGSSKSSPAYLSSPHKIKQELTNFVCKKNHTVNILGFFRNYSVVECKKQL